MKQDAAPVLLAVMQHLQTVLMPCYQIRLSFLLQISETAICGRPDIPVESLGQQSVTMLLKIFTAEDGRSDRSVEKKWLLPALPDKEGLGACCRPGVRSAHRRSAASWVSAHPSGTAESSHLPSRSPLPPPAL